MNSEEVTTRWNESDHIITPFGRDSRIWKEFGSRKALYWWSRVLEYSDGLSTYAAAPKCWEVEPGVYRDELFKDQP